MTRDFPRRTVRTAVAACAAALLAGTMAAPASAEVVWDPDTLGVRYDPPEGFYSYAPSVVRDGDTTWIWSCHNDEHRVIKDHIYATKIVDGEVVSSESVLQASPAPAWDSFHVCDPSVVRGRFRHDGETYPYAMFYLGNDLDASAHNQIGVAFARRPEGPWVKRPEPVVTFDRTDQWGVGQPSAVTLTPGSGRVVLFYTRGDTSTRAYQRVLNLGRTGGIRVSEPVRLSTDGLTGHDGSPDWLNGYDVAFHPRERRFYVVREQHPYPAEGDNPWWIGPSVQVASIDAHSVFHGGGRWREEAVIDHALTGLDRNHNAGITRSWSGRLPDPPRLETVFTDSCSGDTCDSLFEYDLWSVSGTIR
ncbi:hypothetical protein CLV30_1033 [Haloactinopolyspora alba]|uniref:Glycosyl hydrolase family 43 n=1 Tax=Haloactinopolyspora alba TaxID=648780 RepID=A0A2P8E8N9_9ACTN|nr:hypothetical protein [Haloactinopolyspora alba]PSL05852.1 hypothetical protein CLV30_1033 [Haloactinopolyspora alba]